MTASAKKAVAEHMFIWGSKAENQRYRNELGLSYYVDPNPTKTGATASAQEVSDTGQVKMTKIFLPDSEVPAKDIILSKRYINGVTRIFDNPLGEVHVTEAYRVHENKFGQFREQLEYMRTKSESGAYGILNSYGQPRNLSLFINRGSKGAAKKGNFILPDTIVGAIHGYKIDGDFSRLKIWVLDDSGSKPAITEREYQIVENSEGYTFKALDKFRKLSAKEVNSFKALEEINSPREAIKAKGKSTANGMTQEGTR